MYGHQEARHAKVACRATRTRFTGRYWGTVAAGRCCSSRLAGGSRPVLYFPSGRGAPVLLARWRVVSGQAIAPDGIGLARRSSIGLESCR